MALIPVEDNPGLFRDEVSGAIINKNRSDFDIYVSSRKRMRSKSERINDLETKVDNLTNDIGDIKSMLQSLVGK
jgi:tetrahydromethanopterin S-methyltransferase subunit B